MSIFRSALTVLLAVLMVAPMEARGASVQAGVGYVKGECRTITTEGGDEKACFQGARGDLQLNFVVRDKEKESAAKTASDDSSGPSFNFFHGGGGRGEAAVILFILLIFGIIWFILALTSKRFTVGVYAAADLTAGRQGGETDVVQSYQSRRAGIQTSLYPFAESNFMVNVGVADVSTKVETTADAGDESLKLWGVSNKIGIGFVPFDGGGMYWMLEVEQTYFSKRALSSYVEDNLTGKMPRHRTGTSFILGYAF